MPGRGSVVFSVEVAGKEVFRSGLMREGMPGVPVDVPLDGAREFVLKIGGRRRRHRVRSGGLGRCEGGARHDGQEMLVG